MGGLYVLEELCRCFRASLSLVLIGVLTLLYGCLSLPGLLCWMVAGFSNWLHSALLLSGS